MRHKRRDRCTTYSVSLLLPSSSFYCLALLLLLVGGEGKRPALGQLLELLECERVHGHLVVAPLIDRDEKVMKDLAERARETRFTLGTQSGRGKGAHTTGTPSLES